MRGPSPYHRGVKVPETPPPARRHTSPTGRIVIPVLLVVLLIVILGRPILVAGLDLDEEEPAPVPTERTNGRRDNEAPTRLATGYPKPCLRNERSSGGGLIAAAAGAFVSARSPGGSQAFALRAEPPIGWSASGRFLATAGADLWTNRGNHIGIAFSRPVQQWAWSPIADCIVGIENNRLVVVRPHQRAEFLVTGVPIATFAFSPDGTQLVYSVDEKRRSGLWIADLRSGQIELLQSSIGWTLTAWNRAGSPLLLREGSAGRPVSPGGLSFAPSDEVTSCEGDIVIVSKDRLVEFGVTGTPDNVAADERFRYTAVSCAPGGGFLVTVVQPRRGGAATSLIVLRLTGAFVEELAQQARTKDHPMWAEPGVVFAGTARGEGTPGPLVWFIPEGGTARTTGLRLDRLGDDLDARLDWSATPPLGHPTTS